MRGSVALLALVLLLGCSPGEDDDVSPGAEVSDFDDPEVEPGVDPGGEPNQGSQAVSVELPGLPIGGSEVVFEEPSTQCANVNISGEPLPPGVQIVVGSFAVPVQFAISAGACGDSPSCLGGHQFTSDSGGCNVALTWTGEPLEEGNITFLAVNAAVLSCGAESGCADALANFEAIGVQTIDVVVPFPEATE